MKIDDWSEPEPMAPLATEWPTFVSSFFFFSFIVRALFFARAVPAVLLILLPHSPSDLVGSNGSRVDFFVSTREPKKLKKTKTKRRTG